MVQLADLSHEDVLFPFLLPYLSHRDWLSLRCVSQQFHRILTRFFQLNRVIRTRRLTEREFSVLTKEAKSLRILVIPNMYWLTDWMIKPVLQRNRKLVTLNLNGCRNLTQGTLQVMTVSCPRLERLHLAGCGWIRPEALEYHAQHHFRLLSNMKPTGKLISPQDALAVMGKIGLRTIGEERKKSRYKGKEDLHSQLTHEPRVIKIKNHRRNSWHPGHLARLDISGNQDINDSAIGVFIAVFHKIIYLNIGFISNLTDDTMKSIAHRLKNLQVLDVSGNPLITDKGVFTVAKHCTKLVKIVLPSPGISESVLSFLQQKGVSCRELPDPDLFMEPISDYTQNLSSAALESSHFYPEGDPVAGPSRPSKMACRRPPDVIEEKNSVAPFSNLLSMD